MPLAGPAPRLIEENMWRAIRYGLDGRLIDFERAEEYPRERASSGCSRGRRRCAPSWASTLAFPGCNGAQRQRRMIAAGRERERSSRPPCEETSATYTEVVEV